MYAGVPTNETNLFDRHDHRAGQSKVLYYHTYLQFSSLLVLHPSSGVDIVNTVGSHLKLKLDLAIAFIY